MSPGTQGGRVEGTPTSSSDSPTGGNVFPSSVPPTVTGMATTTVSAAAASAKRHQDPATPTSPGAAITPYPLLILHAKLPSEVVGGLLSNAIVEQCVVSSSDVLAALKVNARLALECCGYCGDSAMHPTATAMAPRDPTGTSTTNLPHHRTSAPSPTTPATSFAAIRSLFKALLKVGAKQQKSFFHNVLCPQLSLTAQQLVNEGFTFWAGLLSLRERIC